MFGLFDDIVLRAEQSRVSYNLQKEEFRYLNANLENYLDDMKIIDNNNTQLQETIEEIRTKYILTLENHLKRLPNDFRMQSQILTDAHLERYRFKSRTRRLVSEREELKRRINFVSINEKDQIKHLNYLQKQERLIENELNQLNEQYQYVLKYVENEKTLYQQSLNKIDQLQIELEQSYIERSKTEFEIQTLKEEVKLMQTTKEFLDDECQTIISTQTDANEYFLSRLNHSIKHIREDFQQLNHTQLIQTENDYEKLLQTLEENFKVNQISIHSEEIKPTQYEQLQNEHDVVIQELNTLNNQNQDLSQQILSMENELYSLKHKRMEELNAKDDELEYSKIELQTLNERLNHLAEYDRNLKFELTLYRGVLESEYKRKQTSTNSSNLIRPTTLRTNKNLNTDRTSWVTSNTIQGKFNNQQQQPQSQEILTTRDRVQSEYDTLGDNINMPTKDVISREIPSNDKKSINEGNLQSQVIELNNEDQQLETIHTNVITQEVEKPLSTVLTGAASEDKSTPSSRTSSINAGVQKTSATSTPLVTQADQLESFQAPKSPSTPVDFQSSSVPPPTQTTFDVDQLSSSITQESSSRTSSINAGTSFQVPSAEEEQQQQKPSPSRTSSISTGTPSDIQKSPLADVTPMIHEFQTSTSNIHEKPSKLVQEDQSTSRTSTIGEKTSPDKQDHHLIHVTSTTLENQPVISNIQQSSSRTSSISTETPFGTQNPPPTSDIRDTLSTFQQEDQLSPHTSSTSTGTSSDVQKSPSISDIHELASTSTQEDQPSSRTSSTSAGTSSDIQKSPSTTNSLTSDIQQSSCTSSISAKTSSDLQESSLSSTAPTVLEYQPQTIEDVRQLTSTSLQEDLPSSLTSSISAGTLSDVQKPLSSSEYPTTTTTTSGIQRSPSLHSEEHQQSSRTSSISTGTPSDIQKSFTDTNVTGFDYQGSMSNIPELPSTNTQDNQPVSRTSSISTGTSSDLQKSPSLTAIPIIPEYSATTSDVHQFPSLHSEKQQQSSSRTSSTSTGTEGLPASFEHLQSQLSSKSSSPSQTTSITNTTPFAFEVLQPFLPTSQEPQSLSEVQESSSRTSSISAGASSEVQKSPSSTTAPIIPDYQPPTSSVFEQEEQLSSRSSPTEPEKPSLKDSTSSVPDLQPPTTNSNEHQSSSTVLQEDEPSFDIQGSPLTSVPIFSEYQTANTDVHQSPSTSQQEHQSLSRTSTTSEQTSSDTQESPPTVVSPTTNTAHELPSTPAADHETLPQVQKSSTTNTDVQEKTLPIIEDDNQITPSKDEFGSANQLNKSSNESDDNLQYEESVSYITDEKLLQEINRNASRESIYSTGPSSIEEFEVSIQPKSNDVQLSSFISTNTQSEPSKQNVSALETNISSTQDKTINESNKEDSIKPSFNNEIEENKSNSNVSSIINDENHLNESNSVKQQDINEQSSLTNIEEVDDSTSQKLENDNEDPNLSIIMQDLRYVFHELANDEDLVEIDDELPHRILDRLEFHDHFIQTLFDGLIRKYLVQAATQSDRSQTLDWVEFRDILFPIISGRYTERHIRKLFDLFDTGHDGYLSLQEIAELLEVLHANDTINLAQNIIEEFDADHDGKLSVDELIQAMRNTVDINEHALSEETENKQWFNQTPLENQTITLEVPIIKFTPKIDERFTRGIILLGRIFRRIGANFETKQLDIFNKKTLSMQLTNEFINNNINISSDNLQLFIQLYFDKKQKTDSLINWIEFREVLFPIINHGFYTKNQIKLWFDIFDINQNRMINQDDLIHLLHLLQIQNAYEIIDKLIEITNNNDSWTLDELIFALDSVDETTLHLLTNHEQLNSFDNDWLSNNI